MELLDGGLPLGGSAHSLHAVQPAAPSHVHQVATVGQLSSSPRAARRHVQPSPRHSRSNPNMVGAGLAGAGAGLGMAQSMSLASDAKYPTTQALITDSERVAAPARSAHSSGASLQSGARPAGRTAVPAGPPPPRHGRPGHWQDAAASEYAPPPRPPISNVPGSVARPMSFVRAMEMSDSLAMQERTNRARHKARLNSTLEEEDSQQMYGSNYEISV